MFSHWDVLVISFVGTVCTVLLLFSYYEILKQHCCGLNGLTISRHRVQRQLPHEINSDDSSLQFQSRGLDSSIIHSIPITQFRIKNEGEISQNSTDCAVCLDEFEEGEWLKHLPNCSHSFHVSCINTWFQSHSNCPLCRSLVYDPAIHHDYSVSMHTLLETLRREDFLQERAAFYQILRSQILQNSTHRWEPAYAN